MAKPNNSRGAKPNQVSPSVQRPVSKGSSRNGAVPDAMMPGPSNVATSAQGMVAKPGSQSRQPEGQSKTNLSGTRPRGQSIPAKAPGK